MIYVYDKGNSAYDKNGNVIVFPKSGKVHMVAGGSYDLQMVVPMDPEGNWKHMIREAIVKAPVPEEVIENAYAGMEADVYVTTEAAALRSGPTEPTTITYGTWTPLTVYSEGDKVTWNGQNWQCNGWVDPPAGSAWGPPPSGGFWA